MKDRSVKDVIVKSAIVEFTRYGLNGARIDRISNRAQANKRMIYYYFGSKNDLYNHVLNLVYQGIVSAMQEYQAESSADATVVQKIQKLWEGYFRYLASHPEYVSMISWENMQRGKYSESAEVERITHPLVDQVRQLLHESDLMLSDLDIRHFILMLLGLGFFYFSNQYTMSMVLGPDLFLDDNVDHYIGMVNKVISSTLMDKMTVHRNP